MDNNSATPKASIVKGRRYVGTQTYTIRGVRGYRDITFTAARDQEPTPMPRHEGTPAQDRVFIDSATFSSAPALFVTGSIRAVTTD